jgi:two-component system repressor protein LuxO
MQNEKPTILVIDDETSLLRFFEYSINGLGYEVVSGTTAADFQQLIAERQYDALLLDLMLPDGNGMELLEDIRVTYPDLPVILITAYGTIDRAVEAMKQGAFDFLPKPVDLDRLTTIIRNAVEHHQLRREVRVLKRRLDPPSSFQGMVGSSEVMLGLYSMVESVAPTSATVMITGQSGVGKELVANAIHKMSRRHKNLFIALNCAAIPGDLLESELFGHEKGAFTGAAGRREGCFKRADGGTLFLDEVCEMDLGLQAKLLRVLQEQSFYRIGGSDPIRVDVRIIAATNQNPHSAVAEGRIREDLYYRLNVVPLRVPALRDRLEDIGHIATSYLLEFSRENNRDFVGFDLQSLAAMEQFGWPGNVRELRNVVEQIVVLNNGERIQLDMLPEYIRNPDPSPCNDMADESVVASDPNTQPPDRNLIRPFWQIEREQIQWGLDLCGGNVQDVARRLEISPATLYRKIEKYGLVK